MLFRSLMPSHFHEKAEASTDVSLKPKKEKTPSAMLGAFQAAAAKRMKETGKFARGVETESPDLSAEQIKLINDNNVVGVLRSIANDPNAHEINRAVAHRRGERQLTRRTKSAGSRRKHRANSRSTHGVVFDQEAQEAHLRVGTGGGSRVMPPTSEEAVDIGPEFIPEVTDDLTAEITGTPGIS